MYPFFGPQTTACLIFDYFAIYILNYLHTRVHQMAQEIATWSDSLPIQETNQISVAEQLGTASARQECNCSQLWMEGGGWKIMLTRFPHTPRESQNTIVRSDWTSRRPATARATATRWSCGATRATRASRHVAKNSLSFQVLPISHLLLPLSLSLGSEAGARWNKRLSSIMSCFVRQRRAAVHIVGLYVVSYSYKNVCFTTWPIRSAAWRAGVERSSWCTECDTHAMLSPGHCLHLLLLLLLL